VITNIMIPLKAGAASFKRLLGSTLQDSSSAKESGISQSYPPAIIGAGETRGSNMLNTYSHPYSIKRHHIRLSIRDRFEKQNQWRRGADRGIRCPTNFQQDRREYWIRRATQCIAGGSVGVVREGGSEQGVPDRVTGRRLDPAPLERRIGWRCRP
jgi:hypothetical protein